MLSCWIADDWRVGTEAMTLTSLEKAGRILANECLVVDYTSGGARESNPGQTI